MDRSPGFGSAALNFRPVKTRFRYGFGPEVLNLAQYRNSLARSTKSTQSHINVLLQLVSIRFQVLFHSPPGVLFTFPSRYWFTIGHSLVFSLAGWSRLIQTGFLVSRPTQVSSLSSLSFRVRGSHPLSLTFPCDSSMILCLIYR